MVDADGSRQPLDVLRNAARGGQERFLVALADAVERPRIVGALTSEGFVLEVESVPEGLARLADESFDLAILDLPDAELDAWMQGNKFQPYTPKTLRNARALKSELLQVRKQGYAMVSQELELGLCSIAVPIRAANGCVVAGLNVSMQYSDKAQGRALKESLPALRAVQPEIEQAIRQGGWDPHVYRRQGL